MPYDYSNLSYIFYGEGVAFHLIMVDEPRMIGGFFISDKTDNYPDIFPYSRHPAPRVRRWKEAIRKYLEDGRPVAAVPDYGCALPFCMR